MTRITAFVLAAVLAVGLTPTAMAANGQIYTLSNDFIKVEVYGKNGGFHIDTVQGDKLKKDDDNKLLLHNSGEYDTSFTSLRITKGGQTKDYIFGRSYGFLGLAGTDIQTRTDGERIVSVWTVDGLEVTQNIELANSASNENGMVVISYSVRNTGSEAADVQARVMLDTALGYQDYAYYMIPKGEGLGSGYTVMESEGVLEGDDIRQRGAHLHTAGQSRGGGQPVRQRRDYADRRRSG